MLTKEPVWHFGNLRFPQASHFPVTFCLFPSMCSSSWGCGLPQWIPSAQNDGIPSFYQGPWLTTAPKGQQTVFLRNVLCWEIERKKMKWELKRIPNTTSLESKEKKPKKIKPSTSSQSFSFNWKEKQSLWSDKAIQEGLWLFLLNEPERTDGVLLSYCHKGQN